MDQLLELEPYDDQLPWISLSKLEQNNGEGEKPAWIALKGIVWDVSNSEAYKQKGGSYGLFAGKDVTLALTSMEFGDTGKRGWREKYFQDRERLECLDEWCDYYQKKYAKVGYLQEEWNDEMKFTARRGFLEFPSSDENDAKKPQKNQKSKKND